MSCPSRFGGLGRRWFLIGGLTMAACLGLAVVLSRSGSADPVGPQPVDRNITVAVAALLKREHLSRHPLDDEMSERWLKMYVKTLDPMKVYFTQADIDSFETRKDDLDDMARRGDVSFGYTVFQTFLQRLDERVKLVDELLKVDHDFTVNEELVTDPELLTFAKNEAEIREMWRKRIKFDLLLAKADKAEKDEKGSKNEKEKEKADKDKTTPAEKISRRYHLRGKQMHQTSSDELLEMYLTSLTTSYDPHTTYMSPSSLDNFSIMMRLKLEGIGAALQFSPEGYTVVNKIIPGGAAEKEGHLKPEDKIIGVGQGTDGEIVDVVDMKLNDVVKLIRGNSGTIVRLKVIPTGQSEPQALQHHSRRDRPDRQRSPQRNHSEWARKPNGQPYRIGVHRPAELLHGHGRRPRRAPRTSRAPPATSPGCSSNSTRTRTARSTPASSTCGKTAADR